MMRLEVEAAGKRKELKERKNMESELRSTKKGVWGKSFIVCDKKYTFFVF